jgi:hypothetical protein
VIATGNDLIYRNTYEEAVAALQKLASGEEAPAAVTTTTSSTDAPSQQTKTDGVTPDRRLTEIRDRLRRYRDLWSQGKYAEAGRELERIEQLAARAN